MLASQMVAVTADLPQYRAAIQTKLETVREVTERPFARIQAELRAVTPTLPTPGPQARRGGANLVAGQNKPIPVEIHTPELSTTATVTRLLSLISGPIGKVGLILVLLVFILLEHESLRDRVVRLAGKGEVSRTMRALGDATEGVSRFFFSQFLVNVIFGAVVGRRAVGRRRSPRGLVRRAQRPAALRPLPRRAGGRRGDRRCSSRRSILAGRSR